MIRNCAGDPTRTAPVVHPLFPTRILPTICPMRIAQRPEVADLVTAWQRARQYGVLPRAGGLEDQDARDLAAFDVCEAAGQEFDRVQRERIEAALTDDPRGRRG